MFFFYLWCDFFVVRVPQSIGKPWRLVGMRIRAQSSKVHHSWWCRAPGEYHGMSLSRERVAHLKMYRFATAKDDTSGARHQY
jgi:hypothetical protein